MQETRAAVVATDTAVLCRLLSELGYTVAETALPGAGHPDHLHSGTVDVIVAELPSYDPLSGEVSPGWLLDDMTLPLVLLCAVPADGYRIGLQYTPPHALLRHDCTPWELRSTIEMVLAQQRARHAIDLAYQEVARANALHEKIEIQTLQQLADQQINALITRLVTRTDREGIAGIATEVLRTVVGIGHWSHGYVLAPTELNGDTRLVACYDAPEQPQPDVDAEKLEAVIASTPMKQARFATSEEETMLAAAGVAAGDIDNALFAPLESRTRSAAVMLYVNGPTSTFPEHWHRPAREMALQIGFILRRKLEEMHLRKLSSAVEQSPVGILVADRRRGRIEYVNASFTHMTGYKLEELVGKRPDELWPDGYGQFAEVRRQVLAGQPWRGDVPGFHKEGKRIWQSASYVPIFDAQGNTTHLLAVLQDITERKHMEEALTHARCAAEQANKAKSEFLANMSHEVRTPMNGVLGMAELLQTTALNQTQQFYVRTIHSSASTLLTIINDILDFSLVEAGQLTIEERPFQLDELIDEIISQYLARPEQDIAFIASIAPRVPLHLRGDTVRLRQIIGNLLNNAFKFTERGMVCLRVDASELDEHRILLRCLVEDTGLGISPDVQGQLFNPFYQVRLRSRSPHQGTGLGLAICQRLLHRMGGDIQVESVPERGSTFSFTLPLALAEGADSPESPVLCGRRLLVIDDYARYREVIYEQATALGTVVHCSAAGQALATARAWCPDLIVIGLDHQHADSLAVAGQLAGCPDLAAIPRVLLTATGIPPGRDQLPPALVTGAYIKPSSIRALSWILQTTLGITAQQRCEPALPARERSAHRILVVEDNIINRQVIVAMLKQLGLQADLAVDGAQAVRQVVAEGNRYDLVLMDCEMPNMNGYEATRAIREHELSTRLPPVPIVALTAHALPEYEQRSITAGMTDHISKPLSLTALNGLLKSYLH